MVRYEKIFHYIISVLLAEFAVLRKVKIFLEEAR
jgi:hypothetical protein